MHMHNPPHPGEVTKALGIRRKTLSARVICDAFTAIPVVHSHYCAYVRWRR